MGNLVNKESWLGREQLRYVEELAWWTGVVSRRGVVEKFGCSPQQASAVIQSYLELNPKAMSYSLKVKRYLANPKMKCVFGVPEFRRELEKEEEMVDQVRPPVRAVNERVMRYLMIGVRQKKVVRIKYQSRSQKNAEWREVVPQAFGYDGVRYHVRAWCVKREAFRDFSLLRVQSIEWPERVWESEIPLDEAWERWVVVRLKINENVSEGMKYALMEDYELSSIEEPIEMTCREAMRPYVLYRMGLDEASELPDISFFELVSD